uniref:Uncharacterized protein n=1 Tax=Picea glauca TaxID=3330 RepID=A0A101M4A1_PICGL|nr:hypothetical protein ABT39_MTgene665 [Picea glauca]
MPLPYLFSQERFETGVQRSTKILTLYPPTLGFLVPRIHLWFGRAFIILYGSDIRIHCIIGK